MESRERWVATTLLAAVLLVIGGIGGAASDATPTSGSGPAHPAHIHVGTCDALDPNPTFHSRTSPWHRTHPAMRLMARRRFRSSAA